MPKKYLFQFTFTKNLTPCGEDAVCIGQINMSLVDSSKVTVSNRDVLKVTVLFEWTLTTVMTRIYVHAIGNTVVESDENSMEPSLVSLKAVKIKYNCISDNAWNLNKSSIKRVNKLRRKSSFM